MPGEARTAIAVAMTSERETVKENKCRAKGTAARRDRDGATCSEVANRLRRSSLSHLPFTLAIMVATACSAAPHSVCRPGEAGARLFAAIKHQLVSRSQKGRHLAPCSGSAGVSVVDAATAAADAPADVWASFADSVSGEYEGVTATFNPDGNPEPLPEYYVPQVGRCRVHDGVLDHARPTHMHTGTAHTKLCRVSATLARCTLPSPPGVPRLGRGPA